MARETRFTNPLRIPHADASSSLVSGKCGYLRQSRNIPITMQNCAIIQVLSFVRYYVRCASFCDFCSVEIASVFKGFRHFCVRLTDKFSRQRALSSRIVVDCRTLSPSPTPCFVDFVREKQLSTVFRSSPVVTASHTPRSHRGACSPVTSGGILVLNEIFVTAFLDCNLLLNYDFEKC